MNMVRDNQCKTAEVTRCSVTALHMHAFLFACVCVFVCARSGACVC